MGLSALFATIRYRMIVIAIAAVTGLSVAVGLAVIFPEEYQSSARVQVDSLQKNQLTGLFEPRMRVAEFLGQQAAIAGSRVVALQVYDWLIDDGTLSQAGLEAEWRDQTGGERLAGNDVRLWAADKLLEKVSIEADAIESTLTISFRSDNAALSSRVANAFADAYTEIVLSKRQRRAARNAENFSDETLALEEDLELAQRELTEFRETSGIVALGAQRLESAEVELASITMRLAEAMADLSEARSLLIQAHSASADQLLTLPLPDDAQAGRQAQSRLGGVLTQIQRIGERYGEQYPDYQEAVNEKTALQGTILQAVEDRASYSARRVQSLQFAADAKKKQVVALQETKQLYDVLEKKVEASRQTYDLVASRSLEESLQSRVDFVDLTLLSRAVPALKPVRPPVFVIALIGLFLGLGIGLCVAVAMEFMDGRVRDHKQVKRLLRAPIVTAPRGVLPQMKEAA